MSTRVDGNQASGNDVLVSEKKPKKEQEERE